jgi:uncharacterized flavoprotein (TIGR03862 family)
MAAEAARGAGAEVDLYEGKGSVGRKFLLAGKGGLNLTHSEDFPAFLRRYGNRQREIEAWLSTLDAPRLREWARGLGIETFVGTSGRVFPADLKAAPLLRRWVRRLRGEGVRFHVHHYCNGLRADGALQFRSPDGEQVVHADGVVLALGGGSWPELGSDGAWADWLAARDVDIAPLRPSNCGFDIGWSDVFAQRHAGHPVKTVEIRGPMGNAAQRVLGEFVITRTGIEGSAIYALSAALRQAIDEHGSARIELDLAPARELGRLERELARPRQGRSLTEHLRRSTGIEGVKAGLLYEVMERKDMDDPRRLAATIKALPLQLVRTRPLAEAISTAGGVRFEALDGALMIRDLPGVFCAGEMLDWEAPTGGYLLTASFASGLLAGRAAAHWLQQRGG